MNLLPNHIVYEVFYSSARRQVQIVMPDDVTDQELRMLAGYVEAMRETLKQAKEADRLASTAEARGADTQEAT